MRIYHTSPEKNLKIHEKGRYGPGLFFSREPYHMHNSNSNVYGLDIDEDHLIDSSSFPYLDQEQYSKIRHVIKDIMNALGVDEETALGFVSNHNFDYFYSQLQDYIENHQGQEDEEEFVEKRKLYKNLSKHDRGQIGYDLQREALRASNLLGKRGVNVEDETGISHLINMMGHEDKLKKLIGVDAIQKFERYQDEEEEKSPHNINLKY